MNIGVIGGGIMGLTLAHKLQEKGRSVTVYESGSQLGGLATYHDFGDFYWDKFYHVILPGDHFLLSLLKELGLESKLRWKKTFTGYYVNQKFYSISSSMEFLLFPPLSMISKCRLAITILYASRIHDWKQMEKITIEEWLVKIGGRQTFEAFWKPLLLAKLGENYKKVSAVFIWTYIKRLFEARDTTAKKEEMGYVQGGYKTVFDRLEESLTSRGATILTKTGVEAITPSENGGIIVTANGESTHFDKVICTSPVNVMEQIADPSLLQIKKSDQQVEYLGVICMILRTKKPFTDYYVLNLADDRIPFTGVIGMSTLVATEETGGDYLTYFPKYMISTDPALRESEEELTEWFMKGVKTLYPELKDDDIIDIHLNRAFKVQPLQVLNYSEIIPKTESLHPDFHIVNTSQFVNGTLNNNSVVKHVSEYLSKYKHSFLAHRQSHNPITFS